MKDLVIVRGGGDIATGIIYKLYKCGFSVLVLETEHPSAIRRHVAFSEAVYEGTQKVEDLICYRADNLQMAEKLLEERTLTLLVDPKGESIAQLQPLAVVDAILAKRNLGTTKDMAPIVVGVGPGFAAGEDVHAVVETLRGHNLGRVIYEGTAEKNTGIPGVIAGVGRERVMYSSAAGILRNKKTIGDIVKQGDIIAMVEGDTEVAPVYATIDGLLRGMIRDGYPVTAGFKVADIDPRESEYGNCFTISDKARCVAGGVLEAILYLRGKRI